MNEKFYENGEGLKIIPPKKQAEDSKNVTFDRSARFIDEQTGFMRVADCNISKETVNPYYGYEIPGYKECGLERDKIYYVYRPGEELEKAASTFDGLPLLMGHYAESAEEPQKDKRVGSIMDGVYFEAPYLKAPALVVTDAEGIEGIESGRCKEISSAYTYIPVLESGEFDGVAYTIKMTKIHGNHVALVPEGRAGHDVVVADSKPSKKGKSFMAKKTKNKLAKDESILEGIVDVLKRAMGGERDEKREETARELGIDMDREDITSDDIVGEIGRMLYALEDEQDDAKLANTIRQDILPLLNKLKDMEDDDYTEDEDLEDDDEEKVEVKVTEDNKKVNKMNKTMPVMDEKKIRQMAVDETFQRYQDIQKACMKVRPIVGMLDPFSYTSPSQVYKIALDHKKIDTKKFKPESFEGMVEVAIANDAPKTRDWAVDKVAMDSIPDTVKALVKNKRI